jgi:hypothetical protein
MMPLRARAAMPRPEVLPMCPMGRTSRGGRWGEAMVRGIIFASQHCQPLATEGTT